VNTSRSGAVGLLAAGAVAGAIVAGTFAANAAGGDTSGTSGSSSTSSYGPRDGRGDRDGGGHAGEAVLTGSNAAKVRAAALKAVPGGTVVRVETDSGDAAYEAHMTRADGTQVTVKFDKSFKVTGVEDGMGK
jgi:hypothetical protein